jgi:hypothetical protein
MNLDTLSDTTVEMLQPYFTYCLGHVTFNSKFVCERRVEKKGSDFVLRHSSGIRLEKIRKSRNYFDRISDTGILTRVHNHGAGKIRSRN